MSTWFCNSRLVVACRSGRSPAKLTMNSRVHATWSSQSRRIPSWNARFDIASSLRTDVGAELAFVAAKDDAPSPSTATVAIAAAAAIARCHVLPLRAMGSSFPLTPAVVGVTGCVSLRARFRQGLYDQDSCAFLRATGGEELYI